MTVQPAAVSRESLGWWRPDASPPQVGDSALREAVLRVTQPFLVLDLEGRPGVASGGQATLGAGPPASNNAYPIRAIVPALGPEQLGDPTFRQRHRLRYACVAGAMANGISSEQMVEAMGYAGMIGFFGSAGLPLDRIEQAIDRIQRNLGDLPYGFNLIHSPSEPDLESATVDLYLRRSVRLISASAYLNLTVPLVRYRVSGIHRNHDGRIVTPNKVVAKVSRVEVARRFFSPPPAKFLKQLAAEGVISAEQAKLAESIPMAEDLTAEADSGGHTDNRPAIALLPTMLALRDELADTFAYPCPLRVGAAGGIATPASAAAAFAMGAAYILTGTINQACTESGTSPAVREMLAQASQADVTMAPAADMFEMGVKVQILKRGTMFAQKARKLYELYRSCDCIEDIPAAQRRILEWDYFSCSLEEAWLQTRSYFEKTDPTQIQRAETDAKHKMALIFRSYLGRASQWAIAGDPARKVDYQIWCGPAMGAFNEWARGSFLEAPDRRDVVTIAMNLMTGAAVLTRIGWLRAQGLSLPSKICRFRPMELSEISALLR